MGRENGAEGQLRRLVNNDYLTMAARLFVGITFIYASFYKIIEPESFARSVWYYHMVPGYLINAMALLLPWVEFFCGVFVIAGFWYRGVVLLVNAMTVVFIAALVSAGLRGLDIDCGCFKAGKASGESAWRAVYFDLVLIIATVQLWFSQSRRWMLQRSR